MTGTELMTELMSTLLTGHGAAAAASLMTVQPAYRHVETLGYVI